MMTNQLPFALLLLATVSTAHAQLLPPPKPGDEQPRADVTRQVQPGAPRPLTGVARSGPGTQTEDDIYIGRKVQGNVKPSTTPARASDWCEEDCRKAPGNVPPGTAAKPLGQVATRSSPLQPQLVRPALPMAAPGNAGTPKPLLGTKSRATGDEDEMEDLDIQRRKVQGLPDNKPSTFTPKTQPGSETPSGAARR